VAEYRALLAGLASALERGVDELEVVSDSELVVKQMRGEYKVKSPTLRELVDEAQALAGRLASVRFTAVRREHNELADRLGNEALAPAGRPPPPPRGAGGGRSARRTRRPGGGGGSGPRPRRSQRVRSRARPQARRSTWAEPPPAGAGTTRPRRRRPARPGSPRPRRGSPNRSRACSPRPTSRPAPTGSVRR